MDKILNWSNRKVDFVNVCRFIEHASTHELACIIEEIRCVHDNLIAWNEDTRLLAKIESVGINGDGIQLNIAKEEVK